MEVKLVIPDELYNTIAGKCREGGLQVVEECIKTILEYFAAGNMCELCASLDAAVHAIKYRETLRELLCRSQGS